MTRTFDEVNEIFGLLDEEIYELTKKGADEFYSFGSKDTLDIASKLSGLTPEEILAWW